MERLSHIEALGGAVSVVSVSLNPCGLRSSSVVELMLRACTSYERSGCNRKMHALPALVTAIRTVSSGDAAEAPSVTRRLDTFGRLLPDPAASRERDRATNYPLASLTVRERQVLVEMAHGRSDSEIAGRICPKPHPNPHQSHPGHAGAAPASAGGRGGYDIGLGEPRPRH